MIICRWFYWVINIWLSFIVSFMYTNPKMDIVELVWGRNLSKWLLRIAYTFTSIQKLFFDFINSLWVWAHMWVVGLVTVKWGGCMWNVFMKTRYVQILSFSFCPKSAEHKGYPLTQLRLTIKNWHLFDLNAYSDIVHPSSCQFKPTDLKPRQQKHQLHMDKGGGIFNLDR